MQECRKGYQCGMDGIRIGVCDDERIGRDRMEGLMKRLRQSGGKRKFIPWSW